MLHPRPFRYANELDIQIPSYGGRLPRKASNPAASARQKTRVHVIIHVGQRPKQADFGDLRTNLTSGQSQKYHYFQYYVVSDD